MSAARRSARVIGVPMVLAVIVAVAASSWMPGAGAQQPTDPPATTVERAEGPVPILTVTDPTVERCGAIEAVGADFAPDTRMTLAVNGTVADERPVTDATGRFTFAAKLPCEQTSGVIVLRADDGAVTVAAEVIIASSPPRGESAAAPDPADADRSAVVTVVARLVLVLVLAAELVALVVWRRRRRRARARRSADHQRQPI